MRRNLDARLARVARAHIAAMSPSELPELRDCLRLGACLSIRVALREQLARLHSSSTPCDELTPGDAVAVELADILDRFKVPP